MSSSADDRGHWATCRVNPRLAERDRGEREHRRRRRPAQGGVRRAINHVRVTLFPVITGQTGLDPICQGAADFDLELVENRTLDEQIQWPIYRPTLH